MRTSLKSVIAVAALLALPSCTAYMYEAPRHEPRHHHAADRRFGVIGVAIARAGETGHGPIVVAHVLPGSPAADADVRPGDRIRAIDGESTRGMTVPEAARLIRGPVDAAVELRLESPRGARLVTLVRVPADAMWREHRCRHGRCDGDTDDGASHDRTPEMVPAPDAAPAPPPVDTDQSLAPELWPPTKPGHHAP